MSEVYRLYASRICCAVAVSEVSRMASSQLVVSMCTACDEACGTTYSSWVAGASPFWESLSML